VPMNGEERDCLRVVHEPVGDVDDEQFLGGAGADAVDAVVRAVSVEVRGQCWVGEGPWSVLGR